MPVLPSACTQYRPVRTLLASSVNLAAGLLSMTYLLAELMLPYANYKLIQKYFLFLPVLSTVPLIKIMIDNFGGYRRSVLNYPNKDWEFIHDRSGSYHSEAGTNPQFQRGIEDEGSNYKFGISRRSTDSNTRNNIMMSAKSPNKENLITPEKRM